VIYRRDCFELPADHLRSIFIFRNQLGKDKAGTYSNQYACYEYQCRSIQEYQANT